MSGQRSASWAAALTAQLRRNYRKACVLFTIMVVLWPYAVSWSDQGASITVINGTRYYLHVVVNNKTFVYVAPRGVVTYELGSFSNAIVDVYYSPGQGITGKATRTLEALRLDTASQTSDCNKNRSGDGCITTTSHSSSVSPISWEVTPIDIISN